RLPEIVGGRPVHKRTRCTRLHIVVDCGAPDCQRHTDDKSDDKSHYPYSLLVASSRQFAPAAAAAAAVNQSHAKSSPLRRNHTRLRVAGTCPVPKIIGTGRLGGNTKLTKDSRPPT